jgi:thiosulfate dehydrogenase
MSRLTVLARFVKGNMPFQATTKLSDEDAWIVSAYLLSQKRPPYEGKSAFPTAESRPFDYPIGPWGDPFPEAQHKFGPFKPILDYVTKVRGERAARAATGI